MVRQQYRKGPTVADDQDHNNNVGGAGQAKSRSAVSKLGFGVIILSSIMVGRLSGNIANSNNQKPAATAASAAVSSQEQQQQQQQQSSSSSSCNKPLKPLPLIRGRGDMAMILEQMNFTHGIEVGVKQGHFARYNLEHWKSCQNYKLVDLWAHQENYEDIANVANEEHQNFMDEAKRILQPWESKTEFYKMYSSQAADEMIGKGMTNTIDFVYVDARHDYCGCKEDIEKYYPLLKPGGIMAGHDFLEDIDVPGQNWGLCQDGSNHPEAVKGAVMEFANAHNLIVGVTYKEIPPSWWFQKPFC